MSTDPLRIISFGGGVQSSAMVALAATHDARFEQAVGGPIVAAVFANVGDDSEHPDALRWVRDVVTPWAAERGLPVIELQRIRRDGTPETLLGRLTREGSRSIDIPVRMINGAPGNRSCTKDFKIDVIGKWLKANGATADDPATVAIGISTDEIQRLNNRRANDYERPTYPLVDIGWSRRDCQAFNEETFGAPAPKSSCYFCPFHRPSTWAVMRRDEPELFDKSQRLEDLLNERRAALGKDPVWLTRFNRRLSDAIGEAQPTLWSTLADGPETCDTGHCFT